MFYVDKTMRHHQEVRGEVRHTQMVYGVRHLMQET
jgi:hypothetical protein